MVMRRSSKEPSLSSGLRQISVGSVMPFAVATVSPHSPIKGDKIRLFLTADVLSFLLHLIDRTEESATGELYLALYELHDPES